MADDLVKRAREWLLSSEYNLPETTDLVRDMADEIERLRLWQKGADAYKQKLEDEIERLRKGYLKPRSDVGWITRNVIDDMREWAKTRPANTEDAKIIMEDFVVTLDAYEKDRMK